MLLSSKTAQLKAENLAQITFRFYPERYRIPQFKPLSRIRTRPCARVSFSFTNEINSFNTDF